MRIPLAALSHPWLRARASGALRRKLLPSENNHPRENRKVHPPSNNLLTANYLLRTHSYMHQFPTLDMPNALVSHSPAAQRSVSRSCSYTGPPRRHAINLPWIAALQKRPLQESFLRK